MNDIHELMQEIVQFTEDRDWDQFHSPVNLAKSIVLEAAELLECYQWSDDADPAAVEEELADMCSSVSGVGRCKVTVTFERGEERVYKGSLLIESKPPKVLGVTVVCKGADSDLVRAEIVGMMSALFDIGANRIAVLKLNY